jgi:hypothetical protein
MGRSIDVFGRVYECCVGADGGICEWAVEEEVWRLLCEGE